MNMPGRMTTLTIKRGDVISCKYKVFKNDPKASHHPFVVVSTRNNKVKILVCTDKRHANKFSNCVNINYRKCRLKKPTCVICSKYTFISESDITSRIGRLSNRDYRRVVTALCNDKNIPQYFEHWR